MLLLDLLRKTKVEFEQIMSLGEASAEAKHLLSFIFKCEIGDLYINGNTAVTESEAKLAEQCIERRLKGEPLAYIIGERWFMGLRFEVNKNVLIPRQDTELLAEAAIQYINENGTKRVLDMCTGSGCMAVSIGKYTNAEVWAADISESALEVAKRNAKDTEINFIQSDLFDKITGRFDLIVCNPPYVTESEYAELMPEVRLYEPKLALVPNYDGLDMYRKIAKDAPNFINAGGALMLEIGSSQSRYVTAMLEQSGFENIQTKKDFARKDRMIFAKRALV